MMAYDKSNLLAELETAGERHRWNKMKRDGALQVMQAWRIALDIHLEMETPHLRADATDDAMQTVLDAAKARAEKAEGKLRRYLHEAHKVYLDAERDVEFSEAKFEKARTNYHDRPDEAIAEARERIEAIGDRKQYIGELMREGIPQAEGKSDGNAAWVEVPRYQP